jgi:hypothetical protein
MSPTVVIWPLWTSLPKISTMPASPLTLLELVLRHQALVAWEPTESVTVDFHLTSSIGVNMIPYDLMTGLDKIIRPIKEPSIYYTHDLDFLIKTREEIKHSCLSLTLSQPPCWKFNAALPSVSGIISNNLRKLRSDNWSMACRRKQRHENVALVLDTSKSMGGLLKKAVKRIIPTLTLADRVTILTFGDYAEIVGDSPHLYEALCENIQVLLDYIDNIEVGEVTNMYDAFETTLSCCQGVQGSRCHRQLLFCHTVFTESETFHPI